MSGYGAFSIFLFLMKKTIEKIRTKKRATDTAARIPISVPLLIDLF